MNRPSTSVEEATIAAFERDGAVPVRGRFDAWVESLRRGVERNIADPGPDVRDYRDEGGGRFFGDYCNWSRIPEYREFLFESPAADIARALMRFRTARLFHEHVLVKETETEIPTPWHQDLPYYCVDTELSCSLWLVLDPVPLETCAQFVAGSHRWGKLYRPERFNRTPLNAGDPLDARRTSTRTATTTTICAGRWNPAMRSPSPSAPCTARRRTARRTGAGVPSPAAGSGTGRPSRCAKASPRRPSAK